MQLAFSVRTLLLLISFGCVFRWFCLFTIALSFLYFFFFLKDPAPTEIYPLPLHAALPIYQRAKVLVMTSSNRIARWRRVHTAAVSSCRFQPRFFVEGLHRRELAPRAAIVVGRSEEHTSELQSHLNLVCRLLLEKKKKADEK